MHVPPGYAMFIPSRDPQGGRPAGRRRRPVQGPAAGRAGAGRGPLRSRRRRARPDRRRRLRGQGPRRRHRRDPPVPVVQPGVRRADGPQPLARLHREPAHRTRGRGRRLGPPSPASPQRRDGRRRRARPGCRRPSPRPRNGHRVTVYEKRRRRPAGRCAWRPSRAEPGRVRRHRAQPAHRVPPPRRDDRVRRRRVAGPRRRAARPTTSSSPPAPSRSGRGGRRPTPTNVVDVRDVLDGTRRAVRRRRGRSTRSASTTPRRWPSCSPTAAARSRSSPTAWSSARTSGITLDMENWWMRADGQGHRAVDRPRADGHGGRHAQPAPPPDRYQRHSRTRLGGARRAAEPGRVAVQRPQAAGVSVQRVGDCVAPRRAHAAVVDGERAGAAV